MKAILGNSSTTISKTELTNRLSLFKSVHLDLGTGDGRFVFKSAQKNPDMFYIGVDPSEKQLQIYAKKATRAKLKNVFFCVGSLELFPEEMYGVVHKLTIILPWGSLLGAIVNPTPDTTSTLAKILVTGGTADIIFGYSQDAEQSEVTRLGLDKLDTNYIYTTILPKFMTAGFKAVCLTKLEKQELANFETTWSKKLRFGQDRPIIHLTLELTTPEASQL